MVCQVNWPREIYIRHVLQNASFLPKQKQKERKEKNQYNQELQGL